MHLSTLKLVMNSILDPRTLELRTWEFGFGEVGFWKGVCST